MDLDGPITHSLHHHNDDRGFLSEVFRADWDGVEAPLLQINISWAKPGVIKAWHYHQLKAETFIGGFLGCVLLVAVSPDSEVRKWVMTPENPQMVTIPPLWWHGYCALTRDGGGLLDCSDVLYDPENPDKVLVDWDSKEVPFDWRDYLEHGIREDYDISLPDFFDVGGNC